SEPVRGLPVDGLAWHNPGSTNPATSQSGVGDPGYINLLWPALLFVRYNRNMVLKIEKDHQRFRQIVKGKIRDDLRKFITKGELIGKEGKHLISIPVPGIDLPEFKYGDNSQGVGAGDGKEGQAIGKGGKGQGKSQGGTEAG